MFVEAESAKLTTVKVDNIRTPQLEMTVEQESAIEPESVVIDVDTSHCNLRVSIIANHNSLTNYIYADTCLCPIKLSSQFCDTVHKLSLLGPQIVS